MSRLRDWLTRPRPMGPVANRLALRDAEARQAVTLQFGSHLAAAAWRERGGTEATAKAGAGDAAQTGYGPFICKTEQAPEHDKEAGG